MSCAIQKDCLMEYEELIDRVIQAHDKSRTGLWDCAKYVLELYDNYGMYERDFTTALCAELGVQVDSVYHWRKAADLRRQAEVFSPGFSVGVLTISHFYTAADYLDRCGLEWVFDWLVVARDAKMSVRRFSAELQTAIDDSGTAEWLNSKLGLVISRLEKLYGASDYAGFSDRKRRRLKRVLILLENLRQ